MQERNKIASLPCQYSHLNLNGLPLRSVSSFSFHLIKYDINAHELIKTLNVCASLCVCAFHISHAMLRSLQTHTEHASQFFFNNWIRLLFECGFHVWFALALMPSTYFVPFTYIQRCAAYRLVGFKFFNYAVNYTTVGNRAREKYIARLKYRAKLMRVVCATPDWQIYFSSHLENRFDSHDCSGLTRFICCLRVLRVLFIFTKFRYDEIWWRQYSVDSCHVKSNIAPVSELSLCWKMVNET